MYNIFKSQIASIFTADPDTAFYLMNAIPILSAFIWFDCIHGVQSGNVRALGEQFKASMVTLVCYYCIGMPLAWHYGFGPK
jgi:multidrug resistance protein, MATE family